MEQIPAIDFTRLEKLVVFDFDDTIYTHSIMRRPNSCHINEVPIFEISDRLFLEKALKELMNAGIHIGIASFGKKSIIIDTMNQLLYGRTRKPEDPNQPPYFNAQNVITVVDVEQYWKTTLKQISSTFKQYIAAENGDIDRAFAKFVKEKRPQNDAKYFCLKLEPEAKIQMIKLLCDYYGVPDRSYVRFFDDDLDNVKAALERGIMAHHVPSSGLTREWWTKQCHQFNVCKHYGIESTTEDSNSVLKKSR